jgi:hypothetical protein
LQRHNPAIACGGNQHLQGSNDMRAAHASAVCGNSRTVDRLHSACQ